MQKKLKVGWFSFTCCEDSTILFTEIMNDHYLKWKKIIEFKSALVLQKKEEICGIDVSFVEGAINSFKQEEKLKRIREASVKLVAVGACAVIGLPSGQRNTFDKATQEEIYPLLSKFGYADKVRKVSDIVKVDDNLPGCPMDENAFLNLLDKFLKEFGIT